MPYIKVDNPSSTMSSKGYIYLVFLILITTDVINARRGGISRGGISRGGISGSRSSIRISQTKINVRYGSRYKPWNYGYNNWRSYGSSGHIYGFVWYTRTSYYRNHPNKEPVICRNEFDNVMDNGTHYEWFICPSENHTSDYHYCCGEEDKQHCCRFWDDGWRTFGVATSFMFFLVFVSALCYCCCCRKRTHSETTYFQRMMSQKISSREGGDVPHQPMAGQPFQPQLVPLPSQPSGPTHIPLEPMPPCHEPPPGFMPMPMPMPMPQSHMGFAPPNASYVPPPTMPEMLPQGPSAPGYPPYPVEGVPDMPPSYTPYQPSAPPYPMDSNLPYPPAGPSLAAPGSTIMHPTTSGYPNSPPPPYGQM